MSWRFIRISTVGLLALAGLSFQLRLLAQQGGLTQPSKPAAAKPVATNDPNAPPFQVGERLSFNVSWSNFVTAARVELEVAERGAFFGQEGYQLRARVETIGYVRSIFTEIDNQYTSYVDPQTILPYRVVNSTQQGQKREDDSIMINQQRHAARFGDGTERQIPASTFDLPSLVYGLRTRELKTGASQKIAVLFGKDIVEVEAQIKQRERVITQAGSYDAIRVDLSGRGGKDNKKYRVRAWFSDDAQHLPVLITSQLPFGEVRAELSNAVLAAVPKVTLAHGPVMDPKDLASNRPPSPDTFQPARDGSYSSEFGREFPFSIGERLSYDVSWLNLASIGKVSFEVRQQGRLNNHRVFEFVGEAATVGSARAVINLNDLFTCYADAETLVPVKTDVRLREGKRFKQITADYEASGKYVRLNNGTQVNIQPKTLDLVSLFYAVRAADLKIGSTHTFSLLDSNHRPKTLIIKVAKQETINSPAGPRDTLQLDIFNKDTQRLIAQAWLTNDARKLPVYLAARLTFGELRLQLTTPASAK